MPRMTCARQAAIPAGRVRSLCRWNLSSLLKTKPSCGQCCARPSNATGYTVEEAPDGNTAIDKIRSRRYLLILSDLKLPGNSGLDVLRESRRVEPTLPVILMTAYGSVEEAVTAMKDGAFDFIQKPVDLDHLKLLLERAAQQQELLRENLAAARRIRAALRLSAHRRRTSLHERRESDDAARGCDGFHCAAAR